MPSQKNGLRSPVDSVRSIFGALRNDSNTEIHNTSNHHEDSVYLWPQPDLPGIANTGIQVWHDVPDATMDVCFVYGLSGTRDRMWTHERCKYPRPQQFLPTVLKNIRILAFGHDAYTVGPSTSVNGVLEHVGNLLNDFARNRRRSDALSRPLVLVAHSLGTIVCKQALLLSHDNP